jgi:hypothetical protein
MSTYYDAVAGWGFELGLDDVESLYKTFGFDYDSEEPPNMGEAEGDINDFLEENDIEFFSLDTSGDSGCGEENLYLLVTPQHMDGFIENCELTYSFIKDKTKLTQTREMFSWIKEVSVY